MERLTTPIRDLRQRPGAPSPAGSAATEASMARTGAAKPLTARGAEPLSIFTTSHSAPRQRFIMACVAGRNSRRLVAASRLRHGRLLPRSFDLAQF